jgi:hypothetical protein
MTIESGDFIYANYPRSRETVLHDASWDAKEREQQRIWRRRDDPEGNHFVDITPQVKQLSQSGHEITIELTSGATSTATEYGESSPGMLIAKVE